MSRKRVLHLVIIAMLILSVGVSARSYKYKDNSGNLDFVLKFGYWMPDGESDLWEYNSEIFLFEPEDLNSFVMGFALDYHVNNFMTLSLEIGASYGWTYTEYADFVDEYGYPIETDIMLGVVPLEVALKINPIGRGHKVGRFGALKKNTIIPYIGAGLGLYLYSYEEMGDYIDFEWEEIIYAEFLSENVGVGYFVVAGVQIPMDRFLTFMVEYKYRWVEAKLSDDFVGFDDFDLSGQIISVGLGFSM